MTPTRTDDPVWYVAYASNLSLDRLTCYLRGGRPVGARRTYVGARDRSPPTQTARVDLSGGLVFAGQSRVWGGGMAFLDVEAGGHVVARAYRLTLGQLSDLVAQECRRPVGTDLVPGVAPDVWPSPSEVYESLVVTGWRDSVPMLALTSTRPLRPAAPSAAYLCTILRGLGEVTGWSADRRADYLLEARGTAPHWSRDALRALAGDVSGA